MTGATHRPTRATIAGAPLGSAHGRTTSHRSRRRSTGRARLGRRPGPRGRPDYWEVAEGRRTLATAVRFTLEELAACAPGRSVEVRVPPFGATQAVAGTVHRRGTPPSVVETDGATWLALATGRLSWERALADGALRASGERCDISSHLPLMRA